MKHIYRRSMLMGAALGGAVLLSGCATTTSGTTTTITLNVAKVTAYANAGLNAAQTIETALLPFPALTAYVAQAKAATTLLQTALNAFAAGVGDQISVSYSDSSVKALVDAVLAAIEQIAGLVGNAVTALVQAGLSITDATVNRVQLVKDAITTVVSVFRALLTSGATTTTTAFIGGPKLAMSEGRALAVLSA